MNIFIRILYFGMTLLILLITACSSDSKKEAAKTEEASIEQIVKRGEYLVNSIGCDDCHSPKAFGPRGPEIISELRFSGYTAGKELPKINKGELQNWAMFSHDLTAAVGPWGVSFAANISSDDSGIGLWTEEQFIKAIRFGKFKGLEGSRQLLPPMPWPVYRNLTDEDLKAIFAYLKTTKPVRNIVPAPIAPNEIKD